MKLAIREDNEATINILSRGGVTSMRHISRTHKVNLAWL